LLASRQQQSIVLRGSAMHGSADQCNRLLQRFDASTFIGRRVRRWGSQPIGFCADTHGLAKATSRSGQKFFPSTSTD
jgi:hypothetical protein